MEVLVFMITKVVGCLEKVFLELSEYEKESD